jgi:hypothetical protein
MNKNKTEVAMRLKRFRYQIMELEMAQSTFLEVLHDTKFSDLWHEFCTETYHARCALQKLQRDIDKAEDRRWFE